MSFLLKILIIPVSINLLCSSNEIALAPSYRITGGFRPLNYNLAQYAVSVRSGRCRKFFGDNHSCGGSIITLKSVVTAGHCVHAHSNHASHLRHLRVVTGTPNRLRRRASTQVYWVSKILVHPEFVKKTGLNDIAILKIRGRIKEFKDFVQRIPLANASPQVGTKCTALGWGRVIQGGPHAADVVYVNLTIGNPDVCRIQFKMREGTLCAIDETFQEGDCCQGDSGGPLICDGVLTGIVSYGFGCGIPTLPGFYADVYYFSDWIIKNTATGLEENCVWTLKWIFTIILWNCYRLL